MSKRRMMQLPRGSGLVSINIQASERQWNLISQAARRQDRSQSDFMLEASYREAAEVLLNQTLFTVNSDTYFKLQAMLDNPPPPTEELRLLLRTKSPWDR